MTSRSIHMAGQRFGALTAIEVVGRKSNGNLVWRLLCDCGTQCEIDGYDVRRGRRTSCQDCGAERLRLASVTHGMSNSCEFSTWTDIQTRCSNENAKSFADYGGRGIKVCSRWLESFDNFFADMGPRPSANHSIERDDVNGDYEPGNCRWATAQEQARNKRNNRLVTIDGVTKIAADWADEAGILRSTFLLRLKAGVSGAALLAPSKQEGCLTFNGITDTYAGWSQRTSIKTSTIAMRVTSYGWPVHKALTQGASL